MMLKYTALALTLFVSSFSLKADPSLDWAKDNVFSPSFSNGLNGAIAFAQYFHDYSSAEACYNDPSCGMPDDADTGLDIPPGSCCDGIDSCYNDYVQALQRIDVALYTLYKNEKTYDLIMRVQNARMTAMRGAGSMSPMGAAAVARMEVDIAKAQQSFQDKFNTKTENNISRLNDFLLDLGGTIDGYCEDSGWYQRYGLPIYIHAKTKFPK